jgi:hypothetical protein
LSSQQFDPKMITRNTWIALAGAVILLISVFLSWYKLSVSAAGIDFSASATSSGWESGALGKLVALLALIAIVVLCLDLFASDSVNLPVSHSQICVVCGGLSILFVLIKFISKPDEGFDQLDISLQWGIFVALIAAIALTVGAYLRMSEPA